MEVSIQELRSATDKLFAHLSESGRATVSIKHDYYWSIPKECRHDPYSQPTDLTLGQLSSDLAELRRIIDGSGEPLAFALVWLAEVIREIGEEVVS